MRLFLFLWLLTLTHSVYCDSGGPYIAVPDLRPDEHPPTFEMEEIQKPLTFFIEHIPELNWNKKYNEPDSIRWSPIQTHYAALETVGHISGRRVFGIRYITKSQLERGYAAAEALLVLAKAEDTAENSHLFTPIYYTQGGPSVYEHTIEFEESPYGALKITRYLSGTGAFRVMTYIRGDGRGGFERFDPEQSPAD